MRDNAYLSNIDYQDNSGNQPLMSGEIVTLNLIGENVVAQSAAVPEHSAKLLNDHYNSVSFLRHQLKQGQRFKAVVTESTWVNSERKTLNVFHLPECNENDNYLSLKPSSTNEPDKLLTPFGFLHVKLSGKEIPYHFKEERPIRLYDFGVSASRQFQIIIDSEFMISGQELALSVDEKIYPYNNISDEDYSGGTFRQNRRLIELSMSGPEYRTDESYSCYDSQGLNHLVPDTNDVSGTLINFFTVSWNYIGMYSMVADSGDGGSAFYKENLDENITLSKNELIDILRYPASSWDFSKMNHYNNPANATFDKIEQFLGSSDYTDSLEYRRAFENVKFVLECHSKPWKDILLTATMKHLPIELYYRISPIRALSRVVLPIKIQTVNNRNFLWAYEYRTNQIRTYSIKSIKEVLSISYPEQTLLSYNPPDKVNYERIDDVWKNSWKW